MNNNENAEYNNTLHFHVYNILCLHIIDNLTSLYITPIFINNFISISQFHMANLQCHQNYKHLHNPS